MNKKNLFNGFTIFVAIACILTFTLNIYNGRFQLGDFRVYYSAAVNLVTGGPVYLVSFYSGSGFYKYSPASLYFFLPYTIFSFRTAAVIHFFILGCAYWYTMILISRLIMHYFSMENIRHEVWLLSLSFGCILIHFARELYVGNINIILLLLCCLSIGDFLKGKDWQGGILLGMVILTKPYLLILLFPMVLRKKWKAMAWMAITAGIGLVLPFIFPGPFKGAGLYHDWIKSIRMHSEGFPGMTSIDYLFRIFMPSWPAWGILVILFLILSFVTLFILNNIQREKKERKLAGTPEMNFAFEWFLLIALLPNLIKTDWVLLLFSAPVITFMIFYISFRKQYWWIPVLVILLFFFGLNSDDLLGRELSHQILHSGLMGLSNFLLVTASLFIFLDHRRRNQITQNGRQ